MNQFIYSFGLGKAEGDSSMRNILGNKGANLAEMCRIGIPVPAGFTIPTDACRLYFSSNEKIPQYLLAVINQGIKDLELRMKRNFGGANKPLLLSVRSGAAASMPGMMDTVLNLGLNDVTVESLSKETSRNFAWDSYRRFIQMYGQVVNKLESYVFSSINNAELEQERVQNIRELSVGALERIVARSKEAIAERGGAFLQSVHEQLYHTIAAVFASWMSERAVFYRNMYNIKNASGTAVTVQAMVFGNLNEQSATGVVFTRNPSTGEKKVFGEFLVNAQGEDVVSGSYTPNKLDRDDGKSMEERMPSVYKELLRYCQLLESHYRDPQDIEFTVEDGKLWILQTRSAKRTGLAAVKIAVNMQKENLISVNEAINSIDPEGLNSLLHPRPDPNAKKHVVGRGLPASPGVASGVVALSVETFAKYHAEGIEIILVRNETTPDDVKWMSFSTGVLTARGGMTSHAAVVARGMGKPCVCGASGIQIHNGYFIIKNEHTKEEVKIKEGDTISILGSTGDIVLGKIPIIAPILPPELETVLKWAEELGCIKVHANAETEADLLNVKKFNADGIGLCRTEHMFFEGKRIQSMRQVIIASDPKEQAAALKQLMLYQIEDFKRIFSAMNNKEVVVRYLDPPLHEFLPHSTDSISSYAEFSNLPVEVVVNKLKQLEECNPMLGHRGCRLAVSYPEICVMQTEAIFRALSEIDKTGSIVPAIMIPFIMNDKEVSYIKDIVLKSANGRKFSFGVMIELPKAALIADKIAPLVDFISFGTNDLTQTTLGISRDDCPSFLPRYQELHLIEKDPFVSLDEGVAQLIKMAVEKARKANPNIKIGVCGEHGGDPESIKFFCKLGIHYVSCSPYRVPIARMVIAQYSINS